MTGAIANQTYRCLHDSPLPEVEGSMSNFDHSIDEGLPEELAGGTTMADYAGWNFHAYVYQPSAGIFVADVHVYGSHSGLFRAESLRELMDGVSDEWGAE